MDIGFEKPDELELYERVGNRIKRAMSEMITVNCLAQKLKDDGIFQFTHTARRFVIDVRNGYLEFLIKPNAKRKNAKTEANLEKLAYLFSVVGINPDDYIVEIIKNTNPHFCYPLKKDFKLY